MAQDNDIAPIPDKKRLIASKNIAADALELTSNQIERLNSLVAAVGERYDEGNMSAIDHS